MQSTAVLWSGQSLSHPLLQDVLSRGGQAAEWPQGQNNGLLCCGASYADLSLAGRGRPGAHKAPYGLLLQHSPDVGSSMNTIEGLATCKAAEAGQTTLSVPSGSYPSLL